MTAIATTDSWTVAERLMLAATFVPQGFMQAAQRSARMMDVPPREALIGHLYAATEMARALDLAPVVALQYMCVINGRVCLYSDAPVALALRSGKVQDRDHRLVNLDGLRALTQDDSIPSRQAAARDRLYIRGNANASYRAFFASAKRDNRWFTEVFDTEDARRAGLLDKSGPWKQYPQRMLKFRAETFLVRNVFPDAMCGLPTVDDVQSIGRADTGADADDAFVAESEETIVELTADEQLDALANGALGEGDLPDPPVVVGADPDAGFEPVAHRDDDRLRPSVLEDLWRDRSHAIKADAGRQRWSFAQWLAQRGLSPEALAPRDHVQALEKEIMAFPVNGGA